MPATIQPTSTYWQPLIRMRDHSTRGFTWIAVFMLAACVSFL
jgi:hypothetical protein